MKKNSSQNEQQEEWETVISFKANEGERKLSRKNFSPPAHTNHLRQAALSDALRLQNLKSPERLAAALKALKAAIKTLPLSKKDKQAPLAEVLKRFVEMDTPPPAIQRLQTCLKKARFWALMQALSDHTLTAHKATIQERLGKGDIKALSEYIEAKIQADETTDPRETKRDRALREVRTEESILIPALEAVLQMHPPAVDRGRRENLTYDQRVQNNRKNNLQSQHDHRALDYCRKAWACYEKQTAALPSTDHDTRRQVASAIAKNECSRGKAAKQEGIRLFLQKVEHTLAAQKG